MDYTMENAVDVEIARLNWSIARKLEKVNALVTYKNISRQEKEEGDMASSSTWSRPEGTEADQRKPGVAHTRLTNLFGQTALSAETASVGDSCSYTYEFQHDSSSNGESSRPQIEEKRESDGPRGTKRDASVPPVASRPVRSTGGRAIRRKVPKHHALQLPDTVLNNTQTGRRTRRKTQTHYDREVRQAARELSNDANLGLNNPKDEANELFDGGDSSDDEGSLWGDEGEKQDGDEGEEQEEELCDLDQESEDAYQPSDKDHTEDDSDGSDNAIDARRRSRRSVTRGFTAVNRPPSSTSRPMTLSQKIASLRTGPVPRNAPRRNKPPSFIAPLSPDDSTLEDHLPTKKPRYSVPRKAKERWSIGTLPSGPVGFKFIRLHNTIREILDQWYVGTHGNEAIGTLEDVHGVAWRNAPSEVGCASNYVSIRCMVKDGVERWTKKYGCTKEEMASRLDLIYKRKIHTAFLQVLKDPLIDPLDTVAIRPIIDQFKEKTAKEKSRCVKTEQD